MEPLRWSKFYAQSQEARDSKHSTEGTQAMRFTKRTSLILRECFSKLSTTHRFKPIILRFQGKDIAVIMSIQQWRQTQERPGKE